MRKAAILGATLVATAGLGLGLLTQPAQASNQATKPGEVVTTGVWYACNDRPITWSLQIQGGGKLKLEAERKRAQAALNQITATTAGRYRFTYVPTSDLRIQWSPSVLPPELRNPNYQTSPGVSILFIVIKNKPIAPGGPVAFDFPFGQPAAGSRGYAGFKETGNPSGDLLVYYSRASIKLKNTYFTKQSGSGRSAYYTWGGLYAMGASNPALSTKISAGSAREMKAMSLDSCDQVAAHPSIEPSY